MHKATCQAEPQSAVANQISKMCFVNKSAQPKEVWVLDEFLQLKMQNSSKIVRIKNYLRGENISDPLKGTEKP